MITLKQSLILAGCVLALASGTATAMAQRGADGLRQSYPPPIFPTNSNDLTPIYQDILNSQRRFLAVTNDAEWMAISPKLLRVVQLKLVDHAVEVRSLFQGTALSGTGGGSMTLDTIIRLRVIHGGLPVVPHEAEDAVQKAVDDHAPMAEVNAALAKVRAARKQRQADLTQAQSELRKVLTPTQAAVLVARGMLD